MLDLTLAIIAINGIGVILYWASGRQHQPTIDLTPLPVCVCARPHLPGVHGPDRCNIDTHAVKYL